MTSTPDPTALDAPAQSGTAQSETARSETAQSETVEDAAATATTGTKAVSRAGSRRAPVLDARCAEAVDLARTAAEDGAGAGGVGEHLRVVAEAERVVTHVFACGLTGYRGWEWSVTVARASRAREVTVSEIVLLPGDDAIRPPAWVPWSERVRPGDLGPGDLLPTEPDDPRLEPGFQEVHPSPDDEIPGLVAHELGLGRRRVLSVHGREEAAERWYEGDRGPTSPQAQAAPAQCSTCGYLVALGGPLRAVFGVCANEWAPADGTVVSYDHGCGAHSEVEPVAPEVVDPDLVVDTDAIDELVLDDPVAG